MRDLVEPRVRRLAADQLGVAEEDLLPELSLVEDLAADSLDLAELGLALEDDLGLAVPEEVLNDVRTYGELVDSVLMLVQARIDDETTRARPADVAARVIRTPAAGGRVLERAGQLTPYIAETIADDALRSGPGTRLDVTVTTSDDATVARVRRQFAWLVERGVEVSVHRGGTTGRRQPTAA